MNDRELLEMAAKAAGINYHHIDEYGVWYRQCQSSCDTYKWNPLTDDGGALRLAVKLKMAIRIFDNISDAKPIGDYATAQEMNGGDPCSAIRRAIVRAAAEIGKAMP